MPVIFVFNGIMISMYGLDHNPPHIHVRYGEYSFTITLKERIVTGSAPADVIRQTNEFIDNHSEELENLWKKAEMGEKINKIQR